MDHTAPLLDPAGLPLDAIETHLAEHRVLAGFSTPLGTDPSDLLLQKCDILVPAAVERVITSKNAANLQCLILAEGANGPTNPDADAILD